MNQFSHLLAGLIFGIATNYALTLLTPIVAIGLATQWSTPLFAAIVLGAILPDVDHRKTKIFWLALLIIFIGVAFLAQKIVGASLLWAIAAGAIAAGAFFFLKPKHRGITHSWQAAIIYCAMLFALTLDKGIALSGLAAYGSHLVVDKL